MATEMLAGSRSAFSVGFALETAVKASISPMMVPNSPSRMAILASRATLDRNGHAGHEHEQNLLHEHPTLLEK